MLSRSAQRNVAGMQLIIADGNIVKSNASSVQLDTQATRIIHKFIERKHAIRTGALFKNSFDKIAQCRLSLRSRHHTSTEEAGDKDRFSGT